MSEATAEKSPFRIRLAQSSDVREITRVINSAFRNAESFFVERDRIDIQSVHEFLAKGKFLVGEHEAAIVGCVYVELGGEHAYIGLLAVDPTLQRSGLGSQLMTAAEDYCRHSGCRFVDLRIVSVRPELPMFYRKRGYVEAGTEPFPDSIPTKLSCHFVKMSKGLAG